VNWNSWTFELQPLQPVNLLPISRLKALQQAAMAAPDCGQLDGDNTSKRVGLRQAPSTLLRIATISEAEQVVRVMRVALS